MRTLKSYICLGGVLAVVCFCSVTAGAREDDIFSLLAEETSEKDTRQPYVSMPQGIGRASPEQSKTPSEVKVPEADAVERPIEAEKIPEKEVIVEKPVVVEKPVEVEKLVEVRVPVTNTVEKIVEKEVVVERTNVVEKIVVDKSREQELLERERKLLEQQNELRAAKDQLGEQLSKERDHRQRLERVIPKENRQFADNFLRITAPSTFYDRKEGYAVFQGGVHVHDNQYDLHSKRAFVFNDPASNTVERIVALGNVAVTNGSQRAYGVKASYYRKTGMVILYGDESAPAIVRDESRVDDQEVVGSKIKFWLNSQQVEVLKARIKTPISDVGSLKKGLMGR